MYVYVYILFTLFVHSWRVFSHNCALFATTPTNQPISKCLFSPIEYMDTHRHRQENG